jgi:hypothetical protein
LNTLHNEHDIEFEKILKNLHNEKLYPDYETTHEIKNTTIFNNYNHFEKDYINVNISFDYPDWATEQIYLYVSNNLTSEIFNIPNKKEILNKILEYKKDNIIGIKNLTFYGDTTIISHISLNLIINKKAN